MEKTPLVSVITVNYNQAAATAELLASLMELSYKRVEIIVVDNNSSESCDWLKERFPTITLIKNRNNLGFAGGNNCGIEASKGSLLLFVNNDTIVPKDFLEPLVSLMEEQPSAGMVSPKIKFEWDPSLIQYAGFSPMSRYTIRNRALGYMQKDGPNFSISGTTASIHGAAFMVKREVVDKIGPMPTLYFLYYEEHDWAEMAKRAGYKLFYEPASTILHKESLSTGKESPLKSYYLNRGRLLYAKRNREGAERLLSLLYLYSIALPKNLFIYLIKRDFNNFIAYYRAHVWFLKYIFLKDFKDDNWNRGSKNF